MPASPAPPSQPNNFWTPWATSTPPRPVRRMSSPVFCCHRLDMTTPSAHRCRQPPRLDSGRRALRWETLRLSDQARRSGVAEVTSIGLSSRTALGKTPGHRAGCRGQRAGDPRRRPPPEVRWCGGVAASAHGHRERDRSHEARAAARGVASPDLSRSPITPAVGPARVASCGQPCEWSARTRWSAGPQLSTGGAEKRVTPPGQAARRIAEPPVRSTGEGGEYSQAAPGPG